MHRTHFPLIYCVNGMTLQINCYQFVLITVPDLKMQMRSTLSIIPGCKNGKDAVALKARCLSLISNRANKCTQIHISSLSGTTFFVFSIFLFPFSTIFFFFFFGQDGRIQRTDGPGFGMGGICLVGCSGRGT